MICVDHNNVQAIQMMLERYHKCVCWFSTDVYVFLYMCNYIIYWGDYIQSVAATLFGGILSFSMNQSDQTFPHTAVKWTVFKCI